MLATPEAAGPAPEFQQAKRRPQRPYHRHAEAQRPRGSLHLAAKVSQEAPIMIHDGQQPAHICSAATPKQMR